MSVQSNSAELVDKKYKWYLYDLGDQIKLRALQAKKERDEHQRGTEHYDFHAGRVLAFNEVISLMQQQANGFDIALDEIHLDDIVPDRDLT